MTKNIPAFPCVFENRTEHQMRTGTGLVVEPGYAYSSTGMTLRDYFAAHAPSEIPSWFSPLMKTERPANIWKGGNGMIFETRHAAHKECGDCFENANYKAQAEWDRDRDVQRFAQWRYLYADAMLAARGDE